MTYREKAIVLKVIVEEEENRGCYWCQFRNCLTCMCRKKPHTDLGFILEESNLELKEENLKKEVFDEESGRDVLIGCACESFERKEDKEKVLFI